MKLVRNTLFAAAACVALVAAPVHADPVTIGSGNTGASFSLVFNGFSGSSANVVTGLNARIDFTFTGLTGNDWNFSYNIFNQSSAPVTGSRVSTFAFNVNPDVTGATGGGIFPNVEFGANQPNGIGTIELCFSSANCPGGGGDGVAQGGSGSGTFTLEFASLLSSITLSDFFIRWQSIDGVPNVTSASGGVTECRGVNCDDQQVPEPATLLLLGSGLLGLALRRRRAA